MTDVPTLTSATQANYAVMNPLSLGSTVTLSNGNLTMTEGGTYATTVSSISMTSGKWYAEMTVGSNTYAGTIGIAKLGYSPTSRLGFQANTWSYNNDGGLYYNSATLAVVSSYTTGDVIGIAFDATNLTIAFYKNNTLQTTQYTAANSGLTAGEFYFATGHINSTSNWNFGQRPFAYTAPTGFKALCTQNLPQPTIQKPSTAMDVVTYTGNGSNGRVISGLNFSPDLVWTKSRSAAYDHALSDTVRGVGFALHSNTTAAEDTSYGLSGVGAGNYTINAVNQLNENTTTYVAWSWKAGSTTSTNTYGSITSTVRANPQAGFSIVSYTGNGTAGATVGHGLGVAPKMIIVKNRITAGFDWVTYHQNMNASPQGGYVSLNSTIAFTSNTGIWNNVAPSSSVFTLGTNTAVNKNAEGHIAYCFSEIEGYSKFGSYTGNGSSDGPFVWCGFRPRWVMYKRADLTENWAILDSARDVSNVVGNQLTPNSSSAEGTGSSNIDIVSNGFKMRSATAGGNVSNGTYIFAAFAESPFKYARAR
ncbi:MAG: hypothetical protein EBS53_12325 [Bacteroidetes bacterium]|nr:hypothetical protein [Bacteroidota bacterium]